MIYIIFVFKKVKNTHPFPICFSLVVFRDLNPSAIFQGLSLIFYMCDQNEIRLKQATETAFDLNTRK